MSARRWIGPFLGPLCMLAVGCSDDDSGDSTVTTVTVTTVAPSPEATTSTPASTSPATTAKPPTMISVAVEPGTETGFEGALADVTGLECTSDGTAWTATGQVTNSATATVDYRIYVALLDAANDTRGLFQVDVAAVAAGATQDWSGSLGLAEPDLTCVLRVEGTAA